MNLPPDSGSLALDFPLPVITDLGALMDAGAQLFFFNLALIAKVSLVVWLPVRFAVNYVTYAAGSQDAIGAVKAEAWLQLLVGCIVMPALIYGLVEKMNGRTPTLSACYNWGLKKAWRMLRARFLVNLAIVIGLVFLIVPGIFFAVVFALVEPVVAIEKEPREGVLTRSQDLTKGVRLRIFGAGAITLALVLLLSLLLALPLTIFDHWFLSAVFDLITDVGFGFLTCVLLVVYLDRVRNERDRAAQPVALVLDNAI